MNLEWDTGTFTVYVQNRVDQISKAQLKARAEGQPVEIPAPNPEQLIQYKQCLCCGFQKPAEKVQAQIICEDCQNIARYVTANISQEEDPLQTLYAALKAYYGARAPAAASASSTLAAGPQA
jgi:hypothetical protein